MRRYLNSTFTFTSHSLFARLTHSASDIPTILSIPTELQNAIRKVGDPRDRSFRALFLTNNPAKEEEYRNSLRDYGVRVSTRLFDDNKESIFATLEVVKPTPSFILKETTELKNAITRELITPDSTDQHHMNPVVNSAVLKVWKPVWNADATLKHVTYKEFTHSIYGYIDTTRLSQGNYGFGWDAVFVNNATEQTYSQAARKGEKISARQIVVDNFIISYLLYRTPNDLKFFPFSPKQVVDFDISVSQFVRSNPYLSNPHLKVWGMDNVLYNILMRGMFFKAATSRPIKNYFSPPFAGLPLTEKKTDVEETVFMVHDMCHHNVPDLIFDGLNSSAHKHIYAAWRMMSEAMTMILADMLYADSLYKSGVDPKNFDSRIYPLFQALNLPEITEFNRIDIIIKLLRANVAYAVMGDDSLWRAMLKPGQEDKLNAFKNHFSKFFIGDHSWTHSNYQNMVKISEYYQTWVSMVGRDQFERTDTVLLSDMVSRIARRGCNTRDFADVVKYTFDEIIETRIIPAFTTPHSQLTDEQQTSNAFYRYMIGQMSFYAKYRNISGMRARADAMISRIKNTVFFDPTIIQEIRDQFKRDVYFCAGKRLFTTSMATNICQLHPVFPPVYIAYDRPEYPSIAAAQESLYKQSDRNTALVIFEERPSQLVTINADRSKYVRVIDGITFIAITALENAVNQNTPAKYRLREKMILAGAEFWDEDKTIVKKPVVGISAVGSFLVSFSDHTPTGMVELLIGDKKIGPFTPKQIAEGLQSTMGSQSFHTYMNPKGKTAQQLYGFTASLRHFSVAHSVTMGITILGISKNAEQEFDVKRDTIHLARLTTARTPAQDEPVFVALTAEGAKMSASVRKKTSNVLRLFERNTTVSDWREERNALWSSSVAMSLGINASLRNLSKLMADLKESGKELEYQEILKAMNKSMYHFFPEIFEAHDDTMNELSRNNKR